VKKIGLAVIVAALAAAGFWAYAAETTPAAGKAEVAKDVKVTVVSVQETRQKDMAKTDVAKASVGPLNVELQLEGASLADVKRIGQAKVTVAKDDAGTSLLPGAETTSSEMQAIEHSPDVKDEPLTVLVGLEAGSRKATKIATLTGTLTALAGGKEEPIVIKDIKSFVGKAVSDPALEKAGVTFKIIKPSKDVDNVLFYEFAGNTAIVVDVELLTATGKEIPPAPAFIAVDESTAKASTIAVENPIPPKAGLKITVLAGAKVLTVPFDLKDIPLP
jgi:hypothetical protein